MSLTLKDIADRAGVSVSTVSRILNNDHKKKASDQTQKKVWQIVQELGYVPNMNAKYLATGYEEGYQNQFKTIGVVYTPTRDASSDPSFAGTTIGI